MLKIDYYKEPDPMAVRCTMTYGLGTLRPDPIFLVKPVSGTKYDYRIIALKESIKFDQLQYRRLKLKGQKYRKIRRIIKFKKRKLAKLLKLQSEEYRK